MDTSSREDWLGGELDKNINWFNKEANKHKRLHANCRYAVFTLTVLSTVLASAALIVPSGAQKVLNVIVVATTATIGAVASLEGMRKPADKWHNERRAEHALRDIKRDLDYFSGPGIGKPDLDKLYQRMLEVLRSAREAWSKHLEAANATTTPPALPPPAAAPPAAAPPG